MGTETTTETGHRHSFPVNDGSGTILNPGVCECGKTYEQAAADRLLAEALAAIAVAYAVPPRVSTHWAVAYGGAALTDPDAGLLEYDDEEEAREHARWTDSGVVAKCTVISLPWETVTAEEPAP